LGQGSYGNVSLVKSEKNKYFYAIKNISNKQILYSKLNKNIELERSILLKVDHPFIVKLVKTLKDENYIYYLMDYIKGKELFDVIRDIGLLNKNIAQFYIGSMMLALKYLHERQIIFRDVKPENIMVLENGFIQLIDFGAAKNIEDRTNSLIGTPQYMAPEVILGDQYSFEVDYWSVGICLYEFVYGEIPFGQEASQVIEIYSSIINE
jgi:cGMP-dependent protein kinase